MPRNTPIVPLRTIYSQTTRKPSHTHQKLISHFAKSARTAKPSAILTRLVTGGMWCWIAHKQFARLAKLKWMIDMSKYLIKVNGKVLKALDAVSHSQAQEKFWLTYRGPEVKTMVVKPWK